MSPTQARCVGTTGIGQSVDLTEAGCRAGLLVTHFFLGFGFGLDELSVALNAVTGFLCSFTVDV